MSVDWSYYNADKFEKINDEFLPDMGEGETMATQMITAINKLVYRWYNDGDVFDNTGNLEGWANDLSSYANWLYTYVPLVGNILSGIFDCKTHGDYEDLLQRVADLLFDWNLVEFLADKEKTGTIYDCYGPFRYVDLDEDDFIEDW